MNLLQVNAAYPPFFGGAEIYTQVISERFVRDGHDVVVVTTDAAEVEYFWNPSKRHVTRGREWLNGVEVIRCRVGHLPFSPWSFYALRRLATAMARWPRAAGPVLWHLASYMPPVPGVEARLAELPDRLDLVHGVNIALEWPLIAAWRYARRRRLPFIVTPLVHVGEPERDDVLINYVMPHQLEVMRDADAVIVQTDIEREALARLGVMERRLHRLGMGVDLSTIRGGEAHVFRKRHDLHGPVVTFLGVVTRDKGSFHLVRAMEQLWARGSDAHLVIAGSQVDEFIHFYECLPSTIRNRILLLGPVLEEEKQDLLAATDVLALPSRIDSFGIVYLEAWAYGKPVIGARAGGVPDVIDEGEDGLLVEFGDESALAGAIHSLLEQPERARRMGRQGRAKVEASYTWDLIYSQFWAICERLAG